MARYKDAIEWIARNDDCEWLNDGNGSLSVTGSLVADLFGKTDIEVAADIRKAIRKESERVRRDVARRLTHND